MKKYRISIWLGVIATSLLLLCACGPSQQDLDATATQEAASNFATQTALAPTATQTSTSTPTPTVTYTPTVTHTPTPIPTDTPTPTETPDQAATLAAETTATMDAITSAALEELAVVDLVPESGEIVWTQQSDLTTYVDGGPFMYAEEFADYISLSNFILKADITWETEAGFAGCAIMFRMLGKENIYDRDYYTLEYWRMSGLPLWTVILVRDGESITHLGGRARTNSAIDQTDGATNTFILKAEKDLFVAYVNGERLSQLQSTAISGPGGFGLYAFQQSGTTVCTLSNAWIWSLDE